MQHYSEMFCDFQSKYDKIGVPSFINGYAPVMKGEFWGIVNEQGVEVVPCEYDHVNLFSEGLAGIEKNGLWGFVNEQGEVIIPFQYEDVSPIGFTDGYIPVMLNGLWGVINKNNEVVVPFEHETEFLASNSLTEK